ncbi:MAG: AAA family ATPase [Erythrobacter sp.]|nr:AAA family ATPase [Erythrobacter sp.]
MVDIHSIAKRYGGTVSGAQALIPTIGHSKADRGTAIKADANAPDGVLVHCFNGGDPLAEKDRLRADGFLSDREKAAPRNRAILKPRPSKSIQTAPGVDTEFVYRDENGLEVFRKIRTDRPDGSKTFAWKHDGGRRKGKGDHPSIPYRLDELVRDTDSLVVMAEGEKCADHLASLGFLATSSKDLPQELPWFAGRKVAILPDNDAEGARIAAKAKEAIEKAGGEALFVELPGLPAKGDICDWRGSAADLEALIAEPDWMREDAPSIEGAEGDATTKLLPLIEIAGWQGDAPPRRSLWGDWLPLHQATMLTGQGGVGKSLCAQMLCTAVALGKPFLGMETERRNALYVSCEDDANELWRRQDAICEAFGVARGAVSGKLFLCSLGGEAETALAVDDGKGGIETTPRWHELVRTCRAFDIGLYAFDNATDGLAADHNAIHPVAAFVNLLTGLAIERDGAAMILHHPNKAGADWLGSIAWHNKVRSRLIISKADADVDPDARKICNPKANYGPSGGEIAFRWHNGAFVRDEDLPSDYAAELSKAIAVQHENTVFLDCLRKRIEQNRPVGPNPSANYAPAQFAQMTEAKGVGKAKLARAMERLFGIGAIEVKEVKREGKGGTKTIIVEVAR